MKSEYLPWWINRKTFHWPMFRYRYQYWWCNDHLCKDESDFCVTSQFVLVLYPVTTTNEIWRFMPRWRQCFTEVNSLLTVRFGKQSWTLSSPTIYGISENFNRSNSIFKYFKLNESDSNCLFTIAKNITTPPRLHWQNGFFKLQASPSPDPCSLRYFFFFISLVPPPLFFLPALFLS